MKCCALLNIPLLASRSHCMFFCSLQKSTNFINLVNACKYSYFGTKSLLVVARFLRWSVCMYVCMYGCTYVRTYICMYVCKYVCTYIYICMSEYNGSST